MSLSDSQLRRVHIIGIGGTLMGAFACFLKRAGIEVTGSDEALYPPMSDVLKTAGIQAFQGYSEANLKRQGVHPQLIVIGNVIRKDNPEALAARASTVPTTSLPAFMEEWLLRDTRNIVVAGTHGKTTTASCMAFVLRELSKDPWYFVGGVANDLPSSFHAELNFKSKPRDPKCFVLEGDEYDTVFWDKVPKFNHYLPNDVILTSCEFDHADIYADLDAVLKAFYGLLARIRKGGRLILCTDFATSPLLYEEALRLGSFPVITYGLKEQAGIPTQYSATRIRSEGDWTSFEVKDRGKWVDTIKIQMPGDHNVANHLAVWIEARELGLGLKQIREALAKFRGVKRRQEIRGEVKGVTVIDDFAHHPTAVRETLNALRRKYEGRRLIAVFEPRSATSRRKIFQEQYAAAFDGADAVFLAKPYDQSRIPVENQFSTETLVSDIRARSKKIMAESFEAVEKGVEQVAAFSQSGDVVAVLSNGGFGGFIPKLLAALGD